MKIVGRIDWGEKCRIRIERMLENFRVFPIPPVEEEGAEGRRQPE